MDTGQKIAGGVMAGIGAFCAYNCLRFGYDLGLMMTDLGVSQYNLITDAGPIELICNTIFSGLVSIAAFRLLKEDISYLQRNPTEEL